MHIPAAFKEDNPEYLLKIMHKNAFATLITTDEKGLPIPTNLPFLIRQEEKDIKLQAHFSINNPQWKHLEENQRVLVIFNGPHSYISPSWYVNSGVPTWDYVTVPAYGSATLYKNPEQTAELVES